MDEKSRTTLMYKKNRGRSKVKLRKQQSQDWCQEKWCCMYDGIEKDHQYIYSSRVFKSLQLESECEQFM